MAFICNSYQFTGSDSNSPSKKDRPSGFPQDLGGCHRCHLSAGASQVARPFGSSRDGMRLLEHPQKNGGGESHMSHIKIRGIPHGIPVFCWVFMIFPSAWLWKFWKLLRFDLVDASSLHRGPQTFHHLICRQHFGGFLSHGGTPIAGWFIIENPIEMDDLEVPQV